MSCEQCTVKSNKKAFFIRNICVCVHLARAKSGIKKNDVLKWNKSWLNVKPKSLLRSNQAIPLFYAFNYWKLGCFVFCSILETEQQLNNHFAIAIFRVFLFSSIFLHLTSHQCFSSVGKFTICQQWQHKQRRSKAHYSIAHTYRKTKKTKEKYVNDNV